MKVVILAGGMGTRLFEETELRPKPMVEIGNSPIIWHIMKTYSHFGFTEFIICLGYKGYVIKEYFSNYFLHKSSVTIDLLTNTTTAHDIKSENWKVTLIDTGLATMTGGRLKYAQEFIGNETFCMTYGDGLSDVNITELVDFHKKSGKYCTVTSIQPPGRFGSLDIAPEGTVTSFEEKLQGVGGWINGGFFVMEPKIFDLIDGEDCIWEHKPMKMLSHDRQLAAFKHTGFWQCMDTLRDKKHLEELWNSSNPPWKIWK